MLALSLVECEYVRVCVRACHVYLLTVFTKCSHLEVENKPVVNVNISMYSYYGFVDINDFTRKNGGVDEGDHNGEENSEKARNGEDETDKGVKLVKQGRGR